MNLFIFFAVMTFLCSIYDFIRKKKQLKNFPAGKIPEVVKLLADNKRKEAILRVQQITFWWPKQSIEFVQRLEADPQNSLNPNMIVGRNYIPSRTFIVLTTLTLIALCVSIAKL